MLWSKQAWSQRENESSGSSRNGLNQVATTLQNGDPSTQSFLEHSVCNGEGCQSQVALKVAVLREEEREVFSLALNQALDVLGMHSVLDLDNEDRVSVVEQDVVLFLYFLDRARDIFINGIKGFA